MHYWKIKTPNGCKSYTATPKGEKPEVGPNEQAVRIPKSAYDTFCNLKIDSPHSYEEEFTGVREHLIGDFDGDSRQLVDLDTNPF